MISSIHNILLFFLSHLSSVLLFDVFLSKINNFETNLFDL